MQIIMGVASTLFSTASHFTLGLVPKIWSLSSSQMAWVGRATLAAKHLILCNWKYSHTPTINDWVNQASLEKTAFGNLICHKIWYGFLRLCASQSLNWLHGQLLPLGCLSHWYHSFLCTFRATYLFTYSISFCSPLTHPYSPTAGSRRPFVTVNPAAARIGHHHCPPQWHHQTPLKLKPPDPFAVAQVPKGTGTNCKGLLKEEPNSAEENYWDWGLLLKPGSEVSRWEDAATLPSRPSEACNPSIP